MSAKIIVFANEKGGTGKSTLAMHILVGLLRMGKKVASFDLDFPQGTLTNYLENRKKFAAQMGTPLPQSIHTPWTKDMNQIYTIDGQVDKIKNDVDYIIIDTPGAESEIAQKAITLADTLITPLNDSLIDLDVLAKVDTASLKIAGPSHFSQKVWAARQQRMIERKTPVNWIVVRNRITFMRSKNAQLMYSLLDALSRRIHYVLADGIADRVIYRELFLKGLTMLDLKENGLSLPTSHSAVSGKQEVLTLLKKIA